MEFVVRKEIAIVTMAMRRLFVLIADQKLLMVSNKILQCDVIDAINGSDSNDAMWVYLWKKSLARIFASFNQFYGEFRVTKFKSACVRGKFIETLTEMLLMPSKLLFLLSGYFLLASNGENRFSVDFSWSQARLNVSFWQLVATFTFCEKRLITNGSVRRNWCIFVLIENFSFSESCRERFLQPE